MRHLLVAIAIAAVAVTAPASARPRFHSFSGTCSISGTTHFDPPVTNTSTLHDWAFDGGGTCSGSLDARSVSGTPIVSHIGGRITASCATAESDPSPGYARFTMGTRRRSDDVWIRFTFHGKGVATEALFTLDGQKSGAATGRATFLTPRTPPDTASRCAGDGVADLPTDVSVATVTPLVSSGRGPRR